MKPRPYGESDMPELTELANEALRGSHESIILRKTFGQVAMRGAS